MSEAPENTRCVLLNPSGRGRTDDLTSDLRARGWETVAFSDPFLAMAALCLEDRAQSARTAWGLRPSRSLSLVIAGGDGADECLAEPLIDAVHRYLPGVFVLRAIGGDLVPVPPAQPPETPETVVTSETTETARTEPTDAPRNPEGAADLRATANEPDELGFEADEPEPVEITREEIDMLFAYGEERGEP